MIVKGNTIPRDGIAKILVIQLGDIGDVVWSTPTFRALKAAYPSTEIFVLLRHGAGALLKADPSIADTFEVPPSKDNFLATARDQIRLLARLRREHFDILFDLRADERGAITGYLSGTTCRVTRFYRGSRIPFWRNHLYSHLVQSTAPPKETHGAAEQSLGLLRACGINICSEAPQLWVSAGTDQKVKEILVKNGMSEGASWVTINPFSRWNYKEWVLERWAPVIDWLYRKQEVISVLVGAKNERHRVSAITDHCMSPVVNLVGATSLETLAGLLSKSRLHIGVDSAAPHIAAATGTPTVTIYGPSPWEEWAPVGVNHRVIIPSDPCVPCHDKGCDGSGRSRCLENLSVERVEEGIRLALENIN